METEIVPNRWSLFGSPFWAGFSLLFSLAAAGRYSVSVNDRPLVKEAPLAESVDMIHRLSFRTGEYRQIGAARSDKEGDDLKGADAPTPPATYWIDDVAITPK